MPNTSNKMQTGIAIKIITKAKTIIRKKPAKKEVPTVAF